MTAKAELAKKVSDAVGAGKVVAVETVDFSDPNRPKTCLEVDFPILPVNQVAAIEGNAGKPIYQMSKWWARRRSSVFRSMLLSAAMKAPADHDKADKAVWDVYYANHQKRGAFKHLKVADIFMGGGTTIVEGSRLGMQMFGNDLNPVAWFIVKNELAQVDRKDVEGLLADVEREVKPQIMPFYACDCPRGHKGTWTQLSTGTVMGAGFDPLALTPEQRKDYQYGRWRTKRGELQPLTFDITRYSEKDRKEFYYDAVEMIYVFWSKHGPCQVTGCGHRTPVMSSPVMAIKSMTVKAWFDRKCPSCDGAFDMEEGASRMAPGVPLVSAPDEKPWAVYTLKGGVTCPHCGHVDHMPARHGKPKNKKVELSLLVHPSWLVGSPRNAPDGSEYGGSVTDTPAATTAWNRERASKLRLLEVRGKLPPTVTCPATGVCFSTETGTVPKRANYACGACGTVQEVLTTVKASRKTGPVAAYAIQGYCPCCDMGGENYGGRFFAPATETPAFDAAELEWSVRRESDLGAWWPRSELPFGFMTHTLNGGIPNHGFTHWWTMFNPRQLLVLTQLVRAVCEAGSASWPVREFVLGAFQQFLRNQNMFCFWDVGYDKLVPHLSNANFHPKPNVVENCVFADLGRGNWASCVSSLVETLVWSKAPWELVSNERLIANDSTFDGAVTGKSAKAECGDAVLPPAELACASATSLPYADGFMDLVITDPPFGGLLHYSELSDFFYVWLRLALRASHPATFRGEFTPKSLEVVANRARNPEDSNAFYQRLLTESWKEAARVLKPGGILAFTFHHAEDAPWVSVLEALFDGGFYIEATYPIRADETKGEGSKPGTFGSQKVEYDIVHVCRKKLDDPKPVSWARLRRQILAEARRLEDLLSRHKKAGLPEADIAVVRRGKALEYFSKHYNRVYLEDGETMPVKDALAGINQVLDQDAGGMVDPPPSNAIPFTWQFCRMFDQRRQLPRDQMQKYLRGTGYSPPEYETAGWVYEDDKVIHMVDPKAFAQAWIGKHRTGLRGDYEQAMFLIGASFEASGINVSETLGNENFRPHPALGGLLEWFGRRGGDAQIRGAAVRARHLYAAWEQKNAAKVKQLNLFRDDGDAA